MLPSARVHGEPVSADSQENGSIFTDSLGTVGHMVGAAPGGRLGVWFGDLCHHAAFLCCWGSRWRELDWHWVCRCVIKRFQSLPKCCHQKTTKYSNT